VSIDTHPPVLLAKPRVPLLPIQQIAWKNDARLLAVIVVAFSLVWPYTKNVILMFAWYWPMTEHSRTQILLWLRRLGKYTLIDVYVRSCVNNNNKLRQLGRTCFAQKLKLTFLERTIGHFDSHCWCGPRARSQRCQGRRPRRTKTSHSRFSRGHLMGICPH
jgi:hypothetical protein